MLSRPWAVLVLLSLLFAAAPAAQADPNGTSGVGNQQNAAATTRPAARGDAFNLSKIETHVNSPGKQTSGKRGTGASAKPRCKAVSAEAGVDYSLPPYNGELVRRFTRCDEPAPCLVSIWWIRHPARDLNEVLPPSKMDMTDVRCADGSGIVTVGPHTTAAPGTPDLETLAQQAANSLTLPPPGIGYNPRNPELDNGTLVNFPTWFWATQWKTMRQRTATPDGLAWVEVTATPAWLTFDSGEPRSRPATCAGPGVAFEEGMRESASSCTYTYRRSSGREPGQVYQATLTVDWEVSWVGSGGRRGTLDGRQSVTEIEMPVLERHTVIVNG